MEIDIDWFEGYHEAKTREEKIKWLEEKELYYKNAGGTFTHRAHQFYGILSQKLRELTSFEELEINKKP